MSIDHDHASALEPFMHEGWITQVLREVAGGKEATVFCCRGGPRSGVPLVAAKVYRPIETRRFRNDAMYVGGREHMARPGRVRRAVEGGTAFGRRVRYHTWLGREWEVLVALHAAGAAVPRPIAAGERGILMPFLGDESGPAPMLHEIRPPDRAAAAAIVDELLWNIELMLDEQVVHGDLSPYNVMYAGGRAVIIDFPQAIDPRLNENGAALLARDVDHVCRWAGRHGVSRPAGTIASRLWGRFVMGEIG